MSEPYIIGVDEVGWGAVAGPLTVCACYVPESNYDLLRNQGFRDSKDVGNRLFTNPDRKKTEISGPKCLMLTQWLEQKCDELADQGQKPLASWAVNSCEAVTVDLSTPMVVKNAEFCTAVLRLIRANNWRYDQVKVVVDGSQKIKGLPNAIAQEAIPKADSTVLPCAVASVIAKAVRDSYMLHLHNIYPEYGFGDHKGYGTEKHLEMLLRLGPVVGVHRWHYLEKWVVNHFKRTRPKGKGSIPKWLHNEKWINEILDYVEA